MTEPAERNLSVRQTIRALLADGPLTARAISERISVSERDVLDHLSHLMHDRAHGVAIVPATCIACGFSFDDRTRARRPSRCPRCRATRIAPPSFRLR